MRGRTETTRSTSVTASHHSSPASRSAAVYDSSGVQMAKESTLGERIRAERLRAGLSQSELAERSGISKPTLSRYENDHVLPSVATLQRLTGALDIPLSKLVADPADGEGFMIDALRRRGVVIRDHGDAERIADLVAEVERRSRRQRA